jgi:hypothetical protein
MKRNMLTTAALAGLLGFGALAATTGSATAYTTRHCDADGCWTTNCDDDGYCHRVWDRHYYTESRFYRGNGYYDRNEWRDYDQNHRRTWVCDAYGNDCHWTYESF